MSGASFAIIAAALIPLAMRVNVVVGRVRALMEHPTLVAFRETQALGERMRAIQAPLEEIRARSARIAEVSAQLLASSGMLRLQVDRISFATRLMLETFVPRLRGSMVD
jgi:hypothetical protein